MEVIPYIESFPSIRTWSVETNAPDFLLLLETEDHVEVDEIIRLFKKAGYSIVLKEKSIKNQSTI